MTTITMNEPHSSLSLQDGVLNVRKEAGWTSHDVVARLRVKLRKGKVGHAGTLDPEATGVLPLLLGRATRIAEYLLEWDKTYLAGLRLGESTDTQDATGTVLRIARFDLRSVAAGHLSQANTSEGRTGMPCNTLCVVPAPTLHAGSTAKASSNDNIDWASTPCVNRDSISSTVNDCSIINGPTRSRTNVDKWPPTPNWSPISEQSVRI